MEESELRQAQMVSLQQQFTRMEGTVRSLLQSQGILEQTAVETVNIMKGNKDEHFEEVQNQPNEPETKGFQQASEVELYPNPDPDFSQDRTMFLLERLKALEKENSALALENEIQREQYECCLDEVANHVVQAVLTQKDLRDECLELRTRVFDLEQQNWALSVLFQQKIRPASDLLLQKLYSRIVHLSAVDLLLEQEKSKDFFLSRNTDFSSNEVQSNGKPSKPPTKSLSQLSLTGLAPVYPQSSCSSSEISLSSACSEFSSGSYTWNDGLSCGKMSPVTWERRLNLGLAAQSNICGPLEEQLPTRLKESQILEGLRKLQRRTHKSRSTSSKVSKSGENECMNSNEGIYSLGIKSSSKMASKLMHVNKTCSVEFCSDSDDPNVEPIHSSRRDSASIKDSWFHCNQRSRSIPESLCSWEELKVNGTGGRRDSVSGSGVTVQSTGYNLNHRPENDTNSINTDLPEGKQTSASIERPRVHLELLDLECPKHVPDEDYPEVLFSESSEITVSLSQFPDEAKRQSKMLSGDTAKVPAQQGDQQCTQSVDHSLLTLSLSREPITAKCMLSEVHISAVFDAEGEFIKHGTPKSTKQSLAKSSDQHLRGRNIGKHPSKGHSITSTIDSCPNFNGSKITSHDKPLTSPPTSSKCTTTEQSKTGNSGLLDQDKPSCFPPDKTSRFIKTTGHCLQSSKPSNGAKYNKGSTSNSSNPSRCMESTYNGKQKTRDNDCEPSKNKLRIPSPPSSPDRTASILNKPKCEGSPQKPTIGVAQQTAPTTVRGPPPRYHNPVIPNMQSTLPIKDKNCLDPDAGCGTKLSPQKPVDRTSQHLRKAAAITETSMKHTFKQTNTKVYLPSANAGFTPEAENVPTSSKNPPPYHCALKGSPNQSSSPGKKGPTHENHHVKKNSIGISTLFEDTLHYKVEPEKSLSVLGPPSTAIVPTNPVKKAFKTSSTSGFKSVSKSPSNPKTSIAIPGKQEKDHINSVSKETTSNTFAHYDRLQPVHHDSPTNCPITKGVEANSRLQEGELHAEASPEEGFVCGEGIRFSRSVSVTAKPQLKPVLGMNGAKARSQSFSTNYIEKPKKTALDGQGKIRTQIITKSSERGNSVSGQSPVDIPGVRFAESPAHPPRSRISLCGGLSSLNSHHEASQNSCKDADMNSSRQKVTRCLSNNDQTGLKVIRRPAKVSPRPSSCVYSSEKVVQKTAIISNTTSEKDLSRKIETGTDLRNKPLEIGKKKVGHTVCAIEKKVMMGIEENVQKCQELEKVTVSATKQKTSSSLANWFGLRKSKLPALSGKKIDFPKGKEEKKMKNGSVLGGKQMQSDKKKDKKKNENQQKDNQEMQNLSDLNSRLSSIMDHCNHRMGQIASHIQSTAAIISKDQYVKELFSRSTVSSKTETASPAEISTHKKHCGTRGDMELSSDSPILMINQRISTNAENEVASILDPAAQDHILGSGCQMRTLDSGIGTFPLPDSITRASCRYIPKSESGQSDGVTPSSSELESDTLSRSDPCYPHSLQKTDQHTAASVTLSDSNVTYRRTSQSCLSKLATTDDVRKKRLRLCAPRDIISSEDKETETERKIITEEFDSTAQERTGQVSTYSGSSSDAMSEIGGPRSTLRSRTGTVINDRKTSNSADHNEETLKRRSLGTSLCIIDYYQHDRPTHLKLDGPRISQYNLLPNESPMDGYTEKKLGKEPPLVKMPMEVNQQDFPVKSLN